MDDIQCVPQHTVNPQALIDLMNDQGIRKYLPLLKGDFTEQDCQAFLNAKQQLWDDHGYGPWAVLNNNSGGRYTENKNANALDAPLRRILSAFEGRCLA